MSTPQHPPLHGLPLAQILELIASDALSVEDYATVLLQRIAERDPIVKAWAHLDPEQVCAQARALDQVPKAQRGRLHGVPVGIKDVFGTSDMPTRHNSSLYTSLPLPPPTPDAAVVSLLRSSGALLLGKTHTTEFAATAVGPPTTNPHDPNHTPGGSSSGSAAAVADFQVPLAIGTQTGGSIIRPASFCGIWGFKPTWGAVGREGAKVHSLVMDTVGWFARDLEGLRLVGEVLGLTDDVEDHPSAHFMERDIPQSLSGSMNDAGVRGVRFAFVKDLKWHALGPATQNAMREGRERLVAAGAVIEDIILPSEFDHLTEWHSCIIFHDTRVAFLPEYRSAPDKLDAGLVAAIEGTSEKTYTRKDYLVAMDSIAALRPRFDKLAQRYAAVVVPSSIDVAPAGIAWTGDHVLNRAWTALHVPVVNVPAFKGEQGLPVGLSLTTARFRDEALLRVAEAVGKVWIA